MKRKGGVGMDSKRIRFNCMIPKTGKRWIAWFLAVALIFSGVPFRNGGVVQVSADNTELVNYTNENKVASGPATSANNFLQNTALEREKTESALLAGDHMQATWGYGETLATSPDQTEVGKLEGQTGTYTNSDGDIIYIDTLSGKFSKRTTDIQVNLGTKIYVPVKGNKITLAIAMNKNQVESADTLFENVLSVEGVSGNLLSAKCKSVGTAVGNFKTVVIECYTDGKEGELLLTLVKNNYFESISVNCELLSEITVSGTITCSEEIPIDCKIILTNVSNGIQYISEINGMSYSVDIPVEDIENIYEISVSNQEYWISAGDTELTVNKNTSSITNNITLEKLNTYILSGSISGFESDYDVHNLALNFLTDEETTFEPVVTVNPESLTYTAKMEKGTTYQVTATGVNDYQVTAPVTIMHEKDATENIVFSKKAQYAVTLSMGTTPDLSSKNVTYQFIHEDGSEYRFTTLSDIKLRDGTYTVSIGGEFEEMAYSIALGKSLTVNGKPITHAITFTPITSWSFAEGTGDYYNKKIEGTTGFYQGLSIDATTGKLVPNGATPNSAQFNTGAVIKVPVTGKCTITVNAYQGQYALYTINGTAAKTDSETTTISYEGEAGYIEIKSTGTAYIKSISVTYPAKEVEFVEQPVMPFVPEDDTDANTAVDTDKIPRASKKDSIVVQPVGQKLEITQTGGAFSGAYKDIKDLGYYVFPMTTDLNKLEFDLVIHSSGGTNGDGAFIGLFTNRFAYTLGIRKGTNARAIYSKAAEGDSSDFAGAGGINNTIELGTPMHIEVTLDNGKPTVTYTIIETGESAAVSLSTLKDTDNGFYYGLVVSDATVTITNMLYTGEDGAILYQQNACYYPEGDAPKADSVSAKAADSREYIDVTWTGTVPEKDGTYVVEMSKDNGEWIELTDSAVGFSYRYLLPEGEGGNYLFRVCGQLGKKELGGTRNAPVVMKEAIFVLGALAKPVVEITRNASSISLKWEEDKTVDYFLVYRYSYDEGEEKIHQIAKVTESSYTDTTVEQEMPYYYRVKAISEATNNESPFSETVWSVATANREGEFVYEEETTEIILTKKSYDTVFTDKVLLEGIVQGTGTLSAYVDGSLATSKELKAREVFSFELTVAEGRNDVNLIFEDEEGKKTRKTYNFVYLTNYDVVVDASYKGADGALVNGIPTYKTVQEAVNSIPSSNTERKVILVMAGEYEERLVINTPYLSLIGENRESTLIHCYPGDLLGEDYEAGGDMSKRCATYIQSGAEEFSAENISFKNDYVYSTPDGKGNKSADALRCDAEKASFVNVKFTGVQDTIYLDRGHQYYYKCRIEGLIDFIYSGDQARVFFNDCEIVFVYESTKTSGYVCAPKTAEDAEYGLTFYQCVIFGEEGCSGTGYLLARPWGPDAYITWIDCYMGKSVYKEIPYGAMSGNQYQDARFFEFGTYGPGFAINKERRQISSAKASSMVSDSYLGWSPSSAIAGVSEGYYIGTIVTDRGPMYVTNEVKEDTYLWTDGDDTGLRAYNMEGYANAYKVSGGGLLIEERNENYYRVNSAEEFLDALLAVKTSGKKSVIELATDINLGSNEVENYSNYSKIIKPYSAQALTHPILIKSGVSILNLEGVYDLTIFSLNGSSIKHANITMKNSENIIIRNIKFDELWEWDEATEGDYDRNDWDYMTIDQGCNRIWIDHCTFFKAYDGVIDVKNPSPTANITISWCEFLPGSEDNIFFDAMMNELAENSAKYPVYQHMLDEGMTKEQVYLYAYGQKKTHLFGQSDEATNAAGIQVTLANNYYKNSMDRMPRLRYGNTHVYNCIMDAQELLDARNAISNAEIAKKIVSNGASSTCGAQVLLENCYISGIQNALNSGNGSSAPGYINAVNSVYYMDGKQEKLEPKNNSTNADQRVLITDKAAFLGALPYSEYILYPAEKLATFVKPFAGAGKLDLTVLQWEKVSYNDSEMPDIEEETTTDPIPEETTPEESQPSTEETTPEESEPSTEETTPEETTPDEPESTAPTEPEEPETTTKYDSDDDDDDSDDIEPETTSLTRREENLVESVVGVSSIKEVTENQNGKLVIATNNEVVFLEKNGTLSKDKWQQVENSWYFFGTDYKAVGGWLKQGEKWYHLNEVNKKMETGWLQTADKKWYLLDQKNGDMKTGWQQTTDGKWYLLDQKNGDMKTGWQQTIDGKWYLLDQKNGDMKTGWQQTANGKWYLLDQKNGDMKTGWQQTIDGKWYLLDQKNGDMKIGWQLVKGIWYYLTTTGAMAEDTITPDGYKVGKDGAWTGEKIR